MISIPIYRAKQIDKDCYVYSERITRYPVSNVCTLHCNTNEAVEIDINTLSIHFPSMMAKDSNRTLVNGKKDLRVFASLCDNGIGGDLVSGKCRDINKDEIIAIHKPIDFKGVVRFYSDTAMGVVVETINEIINSTKYTKPIVVKIGESLRWSDCRHNLIIEGIK